MRESFRVVLLLTALSVALPLGAVAGDSVRSLARQIDESIADELGGASQESLVDESAFLRRVTLDLAGRIPTVAERNAFLGSESLTKRADLVAQLIDSPDFPFHLRNVLDDLLLRRLRHDDPWREYLLEATQENRPWDQLFREILAPDVARPEDVRPVAYLNHRIRDLDAMANDTSILWFGVNVACAKCHDHPLVDDWKQDHYFGLTSFFKRTYRTRKGTLAERFEGDVRYETTEGEQRDARFMYLTGKWVEEPEHGLDEETLKKHREAIKAAERDEKAEPPKPDFHPRNELVELALQESGDGFFAKNITNRVWAMMFGRGLVHPLDQLHSENPASHPELLTRLSRDLHTHHYDLRRLVSAIAMSDAYARRLPADAVDTDPTKFGSAMPRALTPHQLALSWTVATSSPDAMKGIVDEASWETQRTELERRTDGIARRLSFTDSDFQVPVSEALWFSNNAHVQNDYLNASNQRLVGYLKTVSDEEDLIRAATISILSREPDATELQTMRSHLQRRSDRREEAIRHLVWALMSTPEFRFNH